MLRNLPPGVKDWMIPGNRKEDIEFERAFEEVCNEYPEITDEDILIDLAMDRQYENEEKNAPDPDVEYDKHMEDIALREDG